MEGRLSSVSKYFKSEDQLGIPGIAVQVTQGVESYLIWAGVTNKEPTRVNDPEELDGIVRNGQLGNDWACSMATDKTSNPISGTTLLRKSNDSVALPLSQRLARRYKKQVFVSIDLPASQTSGGLGPTLALAVEKSIIAVLNSLESPATK